LGFLSDTFFQKMTKYINIYTDGGARGNPGPAAIGVYIEDQDGQEIFSFGKRIGNTTNNVAEYRAVIEALRWFIENSELGKIESLNFYLDSNLVCSQINGLFKVKNSNLRLHLYQVRELESKIDIPINYTFVPREQNKKADKMVNLALDSKL
jgi:ribonuclease HI